MTEIGFVSTCLHAGENRTPNGRDGSFAPENFFKINEVPRWNKRFRDGSPFFFNVKDGWDVSRDRTICHESRSLAALSLSPHIVYSALRTSAISIFYFLLAPSPFFSFILRLGLLE